MPSQFSVIAYIMEQIAGTGAVSYRKMFGEYLIYLNGKPIFLVCDDRLFVKVLPVTQPLMKGKALGLPYPGCKQPHYIVDDLDDRELLSALALTLEKVTAIPKPKKKKSAK